MITVIEFYVGPSRGEAEKVLNAVKKDPAVIQPKILDRYGELSVTYAVSNQEAKERTVNMLKSSFEGFIV